MTVNSRYTVEGQIACLWAVDVDKMSQSLPVALPVGSRQTYTELPFSLTQISGTLRCKIHFIFRVGGLFKRGLLQSQGWDFAGDCVVTSLRLLERFP